MFLISISSYVCSTFCQSNGSKVVHVHDVPVHLQGQVLSGGFDLHAAVEDQDVHAAIALHHLGSHVFHAVHIAEVQQHQFGREGL